jgi:hypothetical protein
MTLISGHWGGYTVKATEHAYSWELDPEEFDWILLTVWRKGKTACFVDGVTDGPDETIRTWMPAGEEISVKP